MNGSAIAPRGAWFSLNVRISQNWLIVNSSHRDSGTIAPMAVIANSMEETAGRIRPFDIRRDLNPVADLIEECFADTLDQDGERYLKQMRSTANNATLLYWAGALIDPSTAPMAGFVWEEDGRIVGNLSLIRFSIHDPHRSRHCSLIANVAVHPQYRRRGIARALTQTGIEEARRRKANSIWLHVREENQTAQSLYRYLGFAERFRRTTWQISTNTLIANGKNPASLPAPDLNVTPRRTNHWTFQENWLSLIYPPEIAWHLPYNTYIFRPGILGAFYRIISDARVRQWSALRSHQLLGVIAWQGFYDHADHLWLATPDGIDEDGIYTLLVFVCRHLPDHRLLTLDFPAHQAEQAILDAGFKPHQTLIWMEYQE